MLYPEPGTWQTPQQAWQGACSPFKGELDGGFHLDWLWACVWQGEGRQMPAFPGKEPEADRVHGKSQGGGGKGSFP